MGAAWLPGATVATYHTFKLTNALIVGIETGGDTTTGGGVTETISFTYQKIDVVDNVNNTTATDEWGSF
jgi:type VI protein secretion system component Hcp